MKKIYSGLISYLVAVAILVTSTGMPVMANGLLMEETKEYEVLTGEEATLLDDSQMETKDEEGVIETQEMGSDDTENIDNVSGNNEEITSERKNETITSISSNTGDNIDEQMGAPIDIFYESSRDSGENKKQTESEGQIDCEVPNYEIAGEAGDSGNVQGTDSYGVEATDNKVQIYASGVYHNWDGISNVTQFEDPNGGMYYAINLDNTVKICKIEDGIPVSKVITLEKQHSLFGTVICDSDGNFYLITGEENKTNDTSVETIFISKYDSSGNFIATTGDNGSSSLAYYYDSSFYTKLPFSGGNCDAAISGDILTVNYARKMYSDHQSNSVFSVNIKDMSKVSVGTFYQSHSFAQRVVPVGTGFVYVSEGDCYDRCFTIYHAKKTNSGFTGVETGIFDFWVKDGALDEYNMYVVNENFAHMGGLAPLTDGRVALAAQSVRSLNSEAANEKEDIFIQIFDPSKNLGTAEAYTTEGIRSGLAGPNGRNEVTNYGVKWLTSLSGTENISNVQITSTAKDRIVILYEYEKDNSYKGVYYIVLDKDGNVIQPATVFDTKALLNPCEMPVYTDGRICWIGNKYNESGNKIYAYSLQLASEKEDIAGGAYADVTWKIDSEGVLNVIGKGDYENQPPWINYSESIVAANIELSEVTNLKDMFYGCSKMNSIDISKLDTSNVTDMAGMFRGCSSLGTLDMSVLDTSNVVTMEGMFNGCSNLTILDISGFDVSKVTNMSVMFENCSELKSIKSPENLKCDIDLPDGNWMNRATGENGIHKIAANTTAGTLFVSDDYIAAVGVEISETELVLGKNETKVLTANVLPKNATNRNIKWSSNKEEVATVDGKGKVTAVSAGEAIITVTTEDGDFVGECKVTALNKQKADVSITENSPITKTYGDSNFTLQATAKNEGTGIGIWTWESSDEKVATVSEEGVVTIKGVGRSSIKVHFESETTVGEAVITLDVTAKTLGIVWNNTTFLYDGASHKPTAIITGVVIGDDCVVNVSGEQTEAGTYTATAVLSGASIGNYSLPEDHKNCSFTISKIDILNLSITGTSDPVSMQKGDKLQLGVTVTPTNATNKIIYWSSSNPEVVSVDESGLITAISEGEAVITVKANDGSGVEASLTVKVASVEITTIRLRVTGTTVMVPGASQQIEAVIKPSNAAVQDLLWTSSDEKIATVADGIITILPENQIEWQERDEIEVRITASSSNNVKSSLTFVIRRPEEPVSGVKIDSKSVKADLKPGDTFRLSAIIEPANATDKTVVWESSNPDKAEISPSGLVTVKDYGETIITVKAANENSDSYKLSITKIPIDHIAVNTLGGDHYLAIGKSAQMSAVITPDNASVKDIVWESSDTSLAEIDENGVVTGKGAGKVTITATAREDRDKTATIDLMIFNGNDGLYVEFAEGFEYNYTGKAIKPLINVYHRGKLLMQGTDYTVKYSNNINANDGTNTKKAPKVVVQGKTVAAKAEAVFCILPLDIGDKNIVTEGEVNVAYGKAAAPLLYYGGKKLGNKDFVNPYIKDKFTSGRGITVYGTGNFTGEREVWINVMDSKEVKSVPKIKIMSFKPTKRVYNGQPQYINEEEIFVVSASDKTNTRLELNKDFYIAYPKDVTNVGTVKVTVIGIGDYAGAVGKSYKIEAAKNDEAIRDIEVFFPHAEGKTNDYDTFEYKPGGVLPTVEILITRDNGKTEVLVAGRDYKVTYKNNNKAGVVNKNRPATATITFLGNYKNIAKITKDFYIDQADLSKANTYAMDKVITKAQPKYPLSVPVVDIHGITVNKKEYAVTYKVGGKTITSKDKLYKELAAPGEAITVEVEIKAKTDKNGVFTGNYKGTAASCQYRIVRSDIDNDLSKATVILQKQGDSSHKAVKQLSFTGKPIKIGQGDFSTYELYVYMGKKKEPVVLEEGTDFYVDYSNNVNAGKATVMINGCPGGKYFGSKTFTFKITNGKMFWAR